MKQRIPSLLGQVATCLLLCTAAAILFLLAPSLSWSNSWQAGIAWRGQIIVAMAFGACCAAIALAILAVPRFRRAVPVASSLWRLDLSGAKPLVIALAAGIGEELLFRAALQPLVGLWFASALFAIAHARTAALGTSSTAKRIAYVANVFVVGVCLGLVYEYLGLLAVVALHTFIDLAALLALRRLQVQGHGAAGT